MQPQPPPTPQSGVSSCYVFKSRLQEYAQKVSLPTPVYETIKEGPSHEPTFRSTVIVNDVRYDSLLGFFNRKAAEQSAAEVALFELSKNGEVSDGISPPVHETGLCKNLLQEYAQKMNYAIPLYECQKVESRGRATFFSCTVDIGGIRYIGAAARTKKEAEIKAARTALLAIQTSDASSNVAVKTDLTVLPCKKRGPETPKTEEASVFPKPKKARFKKRLSKKKQLKFKTGLNNDKLEIAEGSNVSGTGAADPQVLLSASTEAVPEKPQFQIEASRVNIKSGLDDDKLKISEEPVVSGTVAVDPQVAAPGESAANGNCDEPGSQMLSSPSLNLGNYICPAEAISSIPDGCGNSFTIEVKDVAVPNLPIGNDRGSQVLMLPSLNLGNHISPVEEVSSVADGCANSCFSEVKEEVSVVGELAPMCQMEQKIVVESMQVAPDDSV